MYTWYEVLVDDVVEDSDGYKFKEGETFEFDENRTNELLDTIANYEKAGAIRQGNIEPPAFPPKKVKPAQT